MEKYDFCSVCLNKKCLNTSIICRACWAKKVKEEKKVTLYLNCEMCGKEKTKSDGDQRYKLCRDCSHEQSRKNSKKTNICSKCGIEKKYTYNILCKSCALSGIIPSDKTRKIWSEQRKGKTPPNKGKKGKSTIPTLETRVKISNAKTGLTLTPEQYKLYLQEQIEQGRRYKLGKSFESKKWSFAIKEKYNFKCVKCGSNKNLHSHHIKSWRHFPELRFDLDNGLCLCQKCHILEHKRGENETSSPV